jgi:HAD superfamily hydrolase (TIGR01509 family)
MNSPVMYSENVDLPTSEAVTLGSTRLVLWDLDGVLLHTLPVMSVAWQRVRDEHGISASFDDYVVHLGRPFPDILHLLDLALARDHVAQIQTTYRSASAEHAYLAAPFPGVRETLHHLVSQDVPTGVVTSKSRETALPLLDRLACPFTVVRTPGQERGKPAPDPLLLALTDVGVDPAEAVYIGDMDVDEEAARRAGIRYVHAGWGYGTSKSPDSPILSDPRELTALLAGGSGQEGEVSHA